MAMFPIDALLSNGISHQIINMQSQQAMNNMVIAELHLDTGDFSR